MLCEFGRGLKSYTQNSNSLHAAKLVVKSRKNLVKDSIKSTYENVIESKFIIIRLF